MMNISRNNRNIILRSLLVIAGIYPLVFPIGLPITVDPWTREYYAVLESLEPGDIVMMESAFAMGTYSLCGYSGIATIRYLWEHNIKFVITGFGPQINVVYDFMLAEGVMKPPPGIEYGVDWIYIGYIPGDEVGMAHTAENPWFMEVDRYGTPLSTLPLTDEIKDLNDFSLIIFLNKSGFEQVALFNQWITPYRIPAIGAFGPIEWTGSQVYYPELLQAMINGIEGAMSLEVLTGNTYKALGYADSMSIMAMLILSFVIVGNVQEFYAKYTKEDK